MDLPNRKTFNQQLTRCLIKDRHRLRQLYKKLSSQPSNNGIKLFHDVLTKSTQAFSSRTAQAVTIQYPDLPVCKEKDRLIDAIKSHQVIIVCGETGSGKTTQLPKLCLEAGLGRAGVIGHTQPRRLAARSVAQRIAEEMQCELGETVGFKIRFSDQTRGDTLVKLMTDGILLQELQKDHFLNQYDCIIIDEAHERSLNIDFLLGYFKSLLPKRRDLKLIITSATIDPERFAQFFDDAPIFTVSGRTYPVDYWYRPREDENEDINNAIVDAARELQQHAAGDILVFLPGEREIREAADTLTKANLKHTEVLPLFSRLSQKEQQRIFQSHAGNRIVLATNVAETSLTVSGIKYVIDTGLARISRYSWRAGIQRLPIEGISRAAANQRAGRCGRTEHGICVRLYSEENYQQRAEFTEPEIQRTNLASVLLTLSTLRIGSPEHFPFIDAPDVKLINDAYRLLHEINAIDERNHLTNTGKQIARLPIDPRFARMLIEADRLHCTNELLIIVSALSIQDPRERPIDHQQAADQAHAAFMDEDSDFISLINLWKHYQALLKSHSKSQARKLLSKSFINAQRMHEWHDVYLQLKDELKQQKIKFNEQAADYGQIHQSILSGLLSNIAFKHEKNTYLGTKNRKLFIFPGSGQFKKQPKWIVSAEVTETQKIYARSVAKINPKWIESLAQHLIKHHYSEAHWEQKSQRVAAKERVTLGGLTIVQGRTINYGPIDKTLSRELFIHGALVRGEWDCKLDFFKHNLNLIDQIVTEESKARRPDLLIHEDDLFQFYTNAIPDEIYDGHSFNKWYKSVSSDETKQLYFDQSSIINESAERINDKDFPDHIDVEGHSVTLSYLFKPNDHKDGVTIHLPIALLNQCTEEQFSWLVPGLLKEKIISLIKGLPKNLRRHFVPAPDFASAALERMTLNHGHLFDELGDALRQITGMSIDREQWEGVNLDDHLQFRFELTNPDGETINASRKLSDLLTHHADEAEKLLQQAPILNQAWPLEDQHTTWDFTSIPEELLIQQHGIQVLRYPCLIEAKKHVCKGLADNPQQALDHSYNALIRLALLGPLHALKKSLHQQTQNLCLAYANLGNCHDLIDDLCFASSTAFLPKHRLPTNHEEFMDWSQQLGKHIEAEWPRLTQQIQQALALFTKLSKKIRNNNDLRLLDAMSDIDQHLNGLIYQGFIRDTPQEQRHHLARYLKGIERRLVKLDNNPRKDREARLLIAPHWNRLNDQDSRLDSSSSEYRWALEEFRITLFAQELGTAIPMSEKRLKQIIQQFEGN